MAADPPSFRPAYDITGGGVAAEHRPLRSDSTASVAPVLDGSAFNAIRSRLVPFACWRAHDLRFEFGSSFVLPGMADELGALKALIDRHTEPAPGGPNKPALTVFGHADPSGDDAFNRSLGGRRAQAVYALLTRRTDLWEQLYASPLGEDNWEPKAIHRIQATLGLPPKSHPPAAERKALYLAYMDRLCSRNSPEAPFKLEASDFLGEGADAGGKADYQSCGEFNPALVFSRQEQAAYASPQRKAERDQDNAPNRRVLIFLFRPGVRVAPSAWPCPRNREGAESCRKRFWSDGEKRRSPAEERREYRDTGDTFACRFYDRLSQRSPCERPPPAGMGWLAVRVFFHARPMRGLLVDFTPFDPKGQSSALRTQSAVTDDDGFAALPDPVPVGYYLCEVDGQLPKRISTVVDTSEPEILVLPIGRPYQDIDGDRDYLANGESPVDDNPT